MQSTAPHNRYPDNNTSNLYQPRSNQHTMKSFILILTLSLAPPGPDGYPRQRDHSPLDRQRPFVWPGWPQSITSCFLIIIVKAAPIPKEPGLSVANRVKGKPEAGRKQHFADKLLPVHSEPKVQREGIGDGPGVLHEGPKRGGGIFYALPRAELDGLSIDG